MRSTFDTNILVYSVDLDADSRREMSIAMIRRARDASCVLTVQALAEFFHVVTRKGRLPIDQAADLLFAWARAFPVEGAEATDLDAAIAAVRDHGMSFWDAMLWATTRRAGCDVILSEDLRDGRSLGGVLFVNPYVPANAALLDAALKPYRRLP